MWREFLEALGICTLDFIDDGWRHTWVIAHGKKPLQWLFWALFGNDVNGQDDLSVSESGKYRGFLRWWLRNPCHNFTKYVLGFGKGRLEYSTGSKYSSFVPQVRVDYFRCQSHPTSIMPRGWWLPFIHGPWFYWGWRSDGAFAMRVKV